MENIFKYLNSTVQFRTYTVILEILKYFFLQGLILERLSKELDNLERYLRHVGNATIIDMLNDGDEQGREFYADSGLTFKWVSILRAAEISWNPDEATASGTVLFRMREDGTVGESPQIVVQGWNR